MTRRGEKYRPWTNKEVATLTRLWSLTPASDISVKLSFKRSKKAICSKAQRLNLGPGFTRTNARDRNVWRTRLEAAIKAGDTINAFCFKHEVSHSHVKALLAEFSLAFPKRPRSR